MRMRVGPSTRTSTGVYSVAGPGGRAAASVAGSAVVLAPPNGLASATSAAAQHDFAPRVEVLGAQARRRRRGRQRASPNIPRRAAAVLDTIRVERASSCARVNARARGQVALGQDVFHVEQLQARPPPSVPTRCQNCRSSSGSSELVPTMSS
jgi:hypothetical protein